jgi:predicted TIM-barrel fold metal-dependent hydrolase
VHEPGETVDRSIPFVDAHHHLWQLDLLDYPWLTEPGDRAQETVTGDYAAFRVDWPAERYAAAAAGQRVIGTVHVEAACDPSQAVDETRWLDSVAAEWGFPNALVVFCDLRGDDVAATLEAHLGASHLVRSVRARPDLPADPRFRRGLRVVERLGLVYELNQSPGGLLEGLEVALAMPGLDIVLGHAGFPRRRDAEYRGQWRREMGLLAQAPNVAVKISGLPMADHQWTVESLRPWVLGTIDAFGPGRSMLGTNWPVDSLFSTYERLVDAYRLILAEAGFTLHEQHAILHATAERRYRISAPVAGGGPSGGQQRVHG